MPICSEEITSIEPKLKRLCVLVLFSLHGLFMFLFVPPRPYAIYISYTMACYSLFVLKMPLNTNQPTCYQHSCQCVIVEVGYNYMLKFIAEGLFVCVQCSDVSASLPKTLQLAEKTELS